MVEWEFDVPQDGLYTIQVDYFPTSGKSSSIIRTVYIDGELPFEQMRSVVFDRVWVDKKDADGNTIRVAPNGNEIRPEQIEAARWQTTYLKDSIGYYPEPFQFYFTQGKHTLRFEAVREPMEIGSIVLCQMKQPPAYQQAKQDFDQRQLKPAQAEPVKLQGERADTKSDPMLVPIYDRSNAGMEPSDPVHLKLNWHRLHTMADKRAIDHLEFQSPGRWVISNQLPRHPEHQKRLGFLQKNLHKRRSALSGAERLRRRLQHAVEHVYARTGRRGLCVLF